MDGVKRYFVQLFKLGGDEQRYAHGALGAVEIVRASDFDAALAREASLEMSNLELAHHNAELIQKCNALDKSEAALREELAEIKESLAYRGSLLNRTQQRAEAAEQRNAEASASMQLATKLLDQTLAALNPTAELSKNIRALLKARRAKPTESGASE